VRAIDQILTIPLALEDAIIIVSLLEVLVKFKNK